MGHQRTFAQELRPPRIRAGAETRRRRHAGTARGGTLAPRARGARRTLPRRTRSADERSNLGGQPPLRSLLPLRSRHRTSAELGARLTNGPTRRDAELKNELGRPFRRSIHILVVDAGDCGACLNEVKQLNNPYYNMHRLGFFITPTPRHADVLLVVGPVTDQMRFALKKVYEAMPTPKRVVAVARARCQAACLRRVSSARNGVADVLPVDVEVPGNPPPPLAILHGLLVAVGRKPPQPLARPRYEPTAAAAMMDTRRSSSCSSRPAAPASCSRWRCARRTRDRARRARLPRRGRGGCGGRRGVC